MNTRNGDDRTSGGDRISNDEQFGELIRSAGRGRNLTPEARTRIRSNVEAAWRESLQTPRHSELVSSPIAHARRRTTDTNTERAGHRRRRWYASALAASLAVVVSVVLINMPQNTLPIAGIEFAQVSAMQGNARIDGTDRDGQVEDVVSVGDRLTTSDTGRVALRLPSGEELRLNTDTIIEIAARDTIRLIAGMVYFDAPPDSTGADFFVRTDFGVVEHVGTQYTASLDGDALVVNVREGEARIRDTDRELAAVMGEQIRIESTGAVSRGEFSADHPDWAWVEDLARADFDGPSSIMALLEWAARESGKQIRVDSEAARNRAEIVTLNQVDGLTPAEVLEVIRSTTEFALSESDATLTVSLR